MSYHAINQAAGTGFQAGTGILALPVPCIRNGTSAQYFGFKRLAGDAPDGLVLSDGDPVERPVRVYHRDTGELIAQVQSASDGTWEVTNLSDAVDLDVQILGTGTGERDLHFPKVRAS